MIPAGRAFYKMSGSGNDFVFVDTRSEPPGDLASPLVIQAVCARGTGVGADGIVFLAPATRGAVRMRYLNSDGSVAALCGNATLCTAKLVVELGISPGGEFEIETDLDVVRARYDGEMPEIDLQAAEQVQECYAATLAEGERRIGFALVGVPHLVVLCDDVDRAEVVARGRRLRHDAGLRQGANVNFVSPGKEGGWRVRTYERGVEAETLACGTGAVAAALLLTRWGEVRGPVSLQTRSGRDLGVRFEEPGGGGKASLAGEARIVFAGVLSELPWQTGSRP